LSPQRFKLGSKLLLFPPNQLEGEPSSSLACTQRVDVLLAATDDRGSLEKEQGKIVLLFNQTRNSVLLQWKPHLYSN
jgi:hypothetical protein